MTWWLVPLAIVVGVVMGALGGGGAIVTTPVLVYLAGQAPGAAMVGSLIVVSVTAIAGIVGHWRAGHVRAVEGVEFSLLGTVGAIVGSLLSMRVPEDVLMILFGALLLMVSALMAKRFLRPGASRSADPPPPVFERRPFRVNLRQLLLVALTATGVGFLTGFFGVGGGFAVVPALVMVLGFSMPQAVATSLLVILLNSLVSLGTRLTAAQDIDWLLIGSFSVLAAGGAILGGRLSRRLPARTLGLGFAALLAVVAVAILAQNLL
ncbi:sulfite exporter TauE/SafE family protein [Tessaracoccus oleiagri]|uniref:Probable membrane transporter protein n=1 Tax=Tessaracoccus oleiagri TaxID=686624 RepID=A0A1G9IEF1_9ACTN|nr:sulfite exporter TauE/SafE family protein [Tessaracoccus oleiagri]SDL23620.1 hypothetical protein SAMN04488242_0894 [Tessaracoccus oleiagri]